MVGFLQASTYEFDVSVTARTGCACPEPTVTVVSRARDGHRAVLVDLHPKSLRQIFKPCHTPIMRCPCDEVNGTKVPYRLDCVGYHHGEVAERPNAAVC